MVVELLMIASGSTVILLPDSSCLDGPWARDADPLPWWVEEEKTGCGGVVVVRVESETSSRYSRRRGKQDEGFAVEQTVVRVC
jgi:hypothetical protein